MFEYFVSKDVENNDVYLTNKERLSRFETAVALVRF